MPGLIKASTPAAASSDPNKSKKKKEAEEEALFLCKGKVILISFGFGSGILQNQ